MSLIIDGTNGLTFPNSSTQTVAGAPLSTPSFTSTIGVGGTAAANTGAGVSFPATQSASSDANTLDDYEEGTWTPTIVASSSNPTVTYGVQRGVYTKVGNIVHCTWQMTFSGLSGGSGYGQIGGFPFTPPAGSSTSPGYYAGCISESPAGLSFGSGHTQIAFELSASTTSAYFTSIGSGVDQNVLAISSFTGAQYYVGSITYRAA